MRPRGVPLLLLIMLENRVVVQFDCHSEQAFFAWRGIWASCAKGRVLCDPGTARLARFLIELHYRKTLPRKPLAKEKAQARKLAPNFISTSSLADSEG